MSSLCHSKVQLFILLYRWEDLEVSDLTQVTAKSYFVILFSHAPGIDKVLVINSSMLLRRQKFYKNSALTILLFYAQIIAYFIK